MNFSNRRLRWLPLLLILGASHFVAPGALAERIKDLASVQGIRNNQLVGYGLVVGLDGTGDQTTQTPFTTMSIINMLAQLGTTLPTEQSLQLKNVAAVMVTANLLPFSRIGQQMDVTVSSMGNAKSLRGGAGKPDGRWCRCIVGWKQGRREPSFGRTYCRGRLG
jgi:flagellar P-ring protein FlgI